MEKRFRCQKITITLLQLQAVIPPIKTRILCLDSGTEPISHRDPIEEALQAAVRGARSARTNTHGKNQSNTVAEGRTSTNRNQYSAPDGGFTTRAR